MSNKRNVVLYLDKELVENTREFGFNLSKTFENHLKQLLTQYSHVNSLNKIEDTCISGGWCGRRDSNPGSQAWKALSNEIDWNAFLEWLLKDNGMNHSRNMLNYAKKFQHCLLLRDLHEVRDLKETVRPNVLKALSALARFLGIHEEFKQLVKNYSLKWGGKSAEDLIIDRITKVENPDEVFEWIKQVKEARPDLSEFVEFMAVTGLRLVEAVQSYNLIIKLSIESRLGEYYNSESGVLEHFKFKETFFRKSKKAFVSFVPAELVERITQKQSLASPVAVQNLVKKKGLKVRFADIREAHATFMTKYLKDNEIDFLHGRVTSNVFMRNYFNPSLVADLKDRAFEGIKEIQMNTISHL